MADSTAIERPYGGSVPQIKLTHGTNYWNARRLKAIRLLVIDGMSQAKAAKACDRSLDYIKTLVRHPEYRARADSMLADVQAELTSISYGHKGRRLLSYDQTARDLDARLTEYGIVTKATRYDKDGNVLEE